MVTRLVTLVARVCLDKSDYRLSFRSLAEELQLPLLLGTRDGVSLSPKLSLSLSLSFALRLSLSA